MNNKENILDAWIVMEQFSEGSIKKNDKKFRTFNENTTDFKTLFLEFIDDQKERGRIKEKEFRKSGLVLYLGIFNFQEIINILKEKYNIFDIHEEKTNSDKFTFAMYFDNQLDFMSNKLFYTMSGYIRLRKELPDKLLEAENSLRKDFSERFEERDFNTVLIEILKAHCISLANCRYGFVKDLETDDINLHSFFIDDLQKAKTIETSNLNRYFEEFTGNRRNLDSHKDSQNFNPTIFQENLQPNFYPLGRFPSNSDFALSFMQQVAVNLALNDKNDIRSVNGPPGTGKTTLLKDIFADLVVKQAFEICKRSSKEISGSLVYWEKAKLGVLPKEISDKSIVVASSNNGAVQNIVNELPLIEDIAMEFKEELLEADYFKMISNSKLGVKWIEKDGKFIRETTCTLDEEKNWGTFSLEGGAKKNTDNLLLKIEYIEKYLKEDYQSNRSIYQVFRQLYDKLKSERDEIQKYSEQVRKLPILRSQYEEQTDNFLQEKHERLNNLKKKTNELETLQHQKEEVLDKVTNISQEVQRYVEKYDSAKRNFDVLRLQQPRPLWFQNMFNKSKVNQYLKNLNNFNEDLKTIVHEKYALSDKQTRLEDQLKPEFEEFNQEKILKPLI